MRAQLHPELAVRFVATRAQTELELAMSFWHLLLAQPTDTTSWQRRRKRTRRAREERRTGGNKGRGGEELHLC